MERTVTAGCIDRVRVEGDDAGPRWWPLLLAAGCFLLARPYEGVMHDARLYMGYAIAPLDPSGIGADSLFAFDRQGSRSLFPLLLRTVMGMAAPSLVALGVTWLSLVAWFAAAWQFVRRAWPTRCEREVAVLVIAVAMLPTTYGPLSLFRYAEPFPSPRVLAEALVLLALSAVLRSRWVPAMLWLAGAGALHPLMAVVGAFVAGWCWLPTDRQRLRIAGVGAMAAAAGLCLTALGASTLWPFRTFDPAWLQALSENRALVFMRHWEPLDWARLVVQGSTIAIALPLLQGRIRTLTTGAAVAAGGSLLLTCIGADLLHGEMLTQLQPWRALWLFAVLAPLCLAWQLLQLVRWRRGGASVLVEFRTCAFVLLVVAWFALPMSAAAAILAALAVLLWWLPVWRPSFPSLGPIPTVTLLLLPLVVVGITVPVARELFALLRTAPGPEAPLRYLPSVVAGGGTRLLGGMLAGLLALWPTRSPSGPVAFLLRAAGASVLAAGLWLFDARTGYQRELERHLDAVVTGSAAGPIADVPMGAVFWPDGNLEAWAFFGRPGYATDIQGSPRVFSRALALQWAGRHARLVRLQSVPAAPRRRLRLDRLLADDPTGIRELCTPPDAPVTVVLPSRPAWAARARRVILPSAQVLVGDDARAPWEVRRSMFVVVCNEVAGQIGWPIRRGN